jgi:hypothetical protein
LSEHDVLNAAYHGMNKRGTSLNNAITTTIQGSAAATVNTGGASTSPVQKGDRRYCFQITLIPKDEHDTDMHSDVDSTRGSDVGSHHGGKKGREPWVLRCDTEEELEMWTVAMREVSSSSFRF